MLPPQINGERHLKRIIGLRVQKATRKDVYQIAELSSEVAKEGIIKEFKTEEVSELISSEKYYIAAAKHDEEILGYTISTYSWGKLHILDTAVKRDKRGMGIGKILIKHLISHAIEKGLLEVYCEVLAKNIPALNLFTGLGFRFKIFSTLLGGFYGLYLPIKKSNELIK